MKTETSEKFSPVLIVGAGLAGLAAAIKLAENGVNVSLISNMPSERAGSCMAEGGINAALDHMGEGDSVETHFAETMEAAAGIADEEAVRRLTKAAPEIVDWLSGLGVRFNLTEDREIAQRAFGGQKFKRTVYAKDSTGKQIMTALIDEVRKYEARGTVTRYSHHSFVKTLRIPEVRIPEAQSGSCSAVCGCLIRDEYTGKIMTLPGGAMIIACGGLHGLFGDTTGARNDTGFVQAELFAEGVRMTNLEFIQFHPTTVSNGKKRMLITEAARGEGGRLCVKKADGTLQYFMEARYPESGNLTSRDVTAREVYKESRDNQVYLDMRQVDHEVFCGKLESTAMTCRTYLHLDPERDLIPVKAGIHYFMGGIDVDRFHRTNVKGLYAAGECAGIYHGANRLGGNSLPGAIFGGRTAAESVLEDINQEITPAEICNSETIPSKSAAPEHIPVSNLYPENELSPDAGLPLPAGLPSPAGLPELSEIRRILTASMSVIRDEKSLNAGLEALDKMQSGEDSLKNSPASDVRPEPNLHASPELLLARAILLSALIRKESRGAHYRSDFPAGTPETARPSKAILKGGEISIEI